MEIRAPKFPESISEGELTKWYKQEGDFVERDDLLADVETEKTTIEIVAQASGCIEQVYKQEGDTIESEDLLCSIDESAEVQASEPMDVTAASASEATEVAASPAARKLASEHDLDLSIVNGTGRSGMVTKGDVSKMLDEIRAVPPAQTKASPEDDATGEAIEPLAPLDSTARVERRVPMTRLRATIAKRLVEVQQTAAMLTTFNEANMDPIMRMRRQYQDEFVARHNGTRLGFMSFFVRASVEALKRFPAVNASLDGDDVVYHGFYDIGVAVSTERGLVVPIVRDADALGLHQIEDQIVEYSEKARENKLSIDEMTGGTFTISNGGVFGSLMSTPILNPPQTAILGMHKIQDRPVVEDGEIVVRPMMYLALSYDHRLIDGQEAVQFLVTIKGMIEDPARILLEL
ncbi:MAG: 2-oxoglutarate dehydrogenase complex dihydrolipoyllysine-residue succinyltransferase [Gammaproteobacteria bacterium]|nr:2-oxoglutarate dehydrogenase complex dihydrolipoyllysine-residue succinyltransferase [Gammaproteobacteria bacterium]